MKTTMIIVGLATALLLAPRDSEALVFISELLADPPSHGLSGDANADGVYSSSQDEFVELLNTGAVPVDISGWTIADAVKTRHEFGPGTLLGAGQYLAVFGGSEGPLAFPYFVTASGGSLGLNNGGDTVTLRDETGAIVDTVIYGSEGGRDESLVREPPAADGDWVLHSKSSSGKGLAFSPGRGPDIPTSAGATVPETETIGMMIMGLAVMSTQHILKRQRQICFIRS